MPEIPEKIVEEKMPNVLLDPKASMWEKLLPFIGTLLVTNPINLIGVGLVAFLAYDQTRGRERVVSEMRQAYEYMESRREKREDRHEATLEKLVSAIDRQTDALRERGLNVKNAK